MAAALPVTKLASLLVKTLSKPLSKRIKHEFSRSEFTQRILIGIGQTSHQITSRMTIWSAGYKVRRITPLESEKALSTGADFVGETFVLLVSGGTVIWEYIRSKEKERVKEANRQAATAAERRALQKKLLALDARVHALETAAAKEEGTLSARILGSQNKYEAPNPKEIVPIADPSSEDDKVPEDDSSSNGKKPPAPDAKESGSSQSSSWWNWRPW